MSSRAWEDIVDLRERCAEAVEERGKQVWGPSEYAAYRLALDAPGEWSAAAVVSGAGRHTLGPLWEVAASTHAWDELEPHLPLGSERELVARERALRGDATDEGAETYEIPLRPEPWEPAYPVASYRPDKADFPEPSAVAMARLDHDVVGEAVEIDDEVDEALHQLVATWADSASGSVSVVQVAGPAESAIMALGRGDVLSAEVDAPQVLARMAWAGASGGAHGRRRGAAVGRYNAWWAASAIAGTDWPPENLGEALGEMRWLLWRPAAFTEGWELHLAVEDADHGLAWALAATDLLRLDELDGLGGSGAGPVGTPEV